MFTEDLDESLISIDSMNGGYHHKYPNVVSTNRSGQVASSRYEEAPPSI